MVRKLIFRSLALAVVVSVLAGGITPGQGGNPPQITFVSFPPEIKADGNPVGGFVGFKDPDGDIAKAEFTVVQATDFQPFSFDPKVKGAKEGVFEFTLATKVPQRVTLRLTLVDEAGNHSQPKDFSFEAVAPILQVTPTSLSFSEQVGRTPPSQTIQITNAGRGTISWTASADQPWISLTPTSGVAPATVTVSLNTAGLAVGSYSGRIVVEAPGVHGSPAIVTVSLTLMPVPPAMLEVSPEKLEFRGRQGAGNPEPKTLTIRNTGGQPLTWTAQANVPWLTISRSSGALQAGERAELQVSANIAGLSAGTLTAQITITAPEARNSPVTVNVTLVLEARPSFTVCPSGCLYNSIAQAITNASAGDIIMVGPGTYIENILITKNIKLIGSTGAIVKSQQPGLPVIFVQSNEPVDIEIHKLVIQGGFPIDKERELRCYNEEEDICPSGVLVSGRARLILRNVEVLDNYENGVDAHGFAEVQIVETKILNNGTILHLPPYVGYGTPGVIVWESAKVSIVDSSVSNNVHIGVAVRESAYVSILNTRVSRNGGSGISVANSAEVSIQNSIIEGNGADADYCSTRLCNGISVSGKSRTVLQGNQILNNASWGIAAILRKCGYESDNFTGQAILISNNIQGNHRGQVCLP